MTIQRTTTTTWRDGNLHVERKADGAYRVELPWCDYDVPTIARVRDLLSAVLAEAEAPAPMMFHGVPVFHDPALDAPGMPPFVEVPKEPDAPLETTVDAVYMAVRYGLAEVAKFQVAKECDARIKDYIRDALRKFPVVAAPASTPAPWKPRVGDVVKRRFGSRRHGFSFIDADWCVESERSPVGVVTKSEPSGCIRIMHPDGVEIGGFQYHFDAASEVEYVRRATAEERQAAGLPKEDEHAS